MNEKNKKVLKIVGTTIVIIGVIIVALGFLFPGLIWRKPLGVNYTATDYKTMNEKLEEIQTGINDGVESIEKSFSSAELTAYINENKFSYLPVDSGEIRINDDNTIEVSGRVNIDLFINEVLKGKYTKEEIENEIPAFGILPNKVNLYTKFSASLTNNIMTIDIKTISVQGVVVPSTYYSSNEIKNRITDLLDTVISDYNNQNKTNFDFVSISENLVKVKISTKS